MEYQLDGIVLRCRNVAELSQFYDKVMRLERFLPPLTEPVGTIARYQVAGGLVFELIGNGPELSAPENRSQVPITPMFRVDDLGQAIEELDAAGVHWISERQAIPGAPAELATFLDPEGHHICVFQMTAEDTSRSQGSD